MSQAHKPGRCIPKDCNKEQPSDQPATLQYDSLKAARAGNGCDPETRSVDPRVTDNKDQIKQLDKFMRSITDANIVQDAERAWNERM